jgi:hypothetical protein
VPASLSVSNLNDAGAGSLRQAISDANSSGDASSTITFNANLSGTISLGSALDDLNKNIEILVLQRYVRRTVCTVGLASAGKAGRKSDRRRHPGLPASADSGRAADDANAIHEKGCVESAQSS